MGDDLRVLVTGSSGFIGNALTQSLKRRFEVQPLCRRPRNVPEALALDLADASAVSQVAGEMAPCQVIVHSAAELDMSPHNPEVIKTNALGTQNVLNLAQRWGAYLIYLSSVQVIGRPLYTPIDEQHPTSPQTTYHATKLLGEHLVSSASNYGVKGVSLRLSAPIGESMPPNRILSVFARRAREHSPLILAGEGSRRQDYVCVGDIVQAVEAAMHKRPAGVFNIASGTSLSNLELAKLCIACTNSMSQITFSGTDREEGAVWEVSVARAQAELNYRPTGEIHQVVRSLAGGNFE